MNERRCKENEHCFLEDTVLLECHHQCSFIDGVRNWTPQLFSYLKTQCNVIREARADIYLEMGNSCLELSMAHDLLSTALLFHLLSQRGKGLILNEATLSYADTNTFGSCSIFIAEPWIINPILDYNELCVPAVKYSAQQSSTNTVVTCGPYGNTLPGQSTYRELMFIIIFLFIYTRWFSPKTTIMTISIATDMAASSKVSGPISILHCAVSCMCNDIWLRGNNRLLPRTMKNSEGVSL